MTGQISIVNVDKETKLRDAFKMAFSNSRYTIFFFMIEKLNLVMSILKLLILEKELILRNLSFHLMAKLFLKNLGKMNLFLLYVMTYIHLLLY